MIRIAICGTRHWVNQDIINRTVAYMARFDAMMVSGGKPKPGYHNNVDEWAEDAADCYDVPKAIFPAQWEVFRRRGNPKAAGPTRNLQIAEFANVAIFFWDGVSTGTANCMQHFDALGKNFITINEPRISNQTAYLEIPTFISAYADRKR